MTPWKVLTALFLISISFGFFKQAKTAVRSVDALLGSHQMPRLEEGGGGFALEPPPAPVPRERATAWTLTFFSALLSLAAGYRLTGRLLGPLSGDPFWRVFLSAGAGYAFTAFCLSVSLFLFGGFSVPALVLLHAAAFFIPPGARNQEKSPVARGAVAVYAVLVLASIAFLSFKFFKSPFGGGVDVWAIWHYKARLIFRDPAEWRAIFSPLADFSHQDYPLLYPLGVVWGWLVSGWETVYPSWLLSFLFTASTAGLLFAVWAATDLKKAALASFLLLGTPHFVGMGASQYADIFVAYFNLAAAALLAQSFARGEERLALAAGFFAAAGAYSKNEGILFFAALAVSAALFGERRMLRHFFLGALPMGLLTVWFKALASSPNEVAAWENLPALFDMARVWERSGAIARAWFEQVFAENAWVYSWFLFAFVLILARRSVFSKRNAWLWCAVLLLHAGYFAVYLITPHEVGYHLRTSLDRLMLHGYPVVAYAVFETWRS